MDTRPLFSEAADSLALAVITSSSAPVLLLDDRLVIIAASESFCEAFQLESSATVRRSLAELGAGEWGGAQLTSLLQATAKGLADITCYEMDLCRDSKFSRCLVINARKLDYFDADNVRLLMSVADVTSARINDKLKDDLVREKTILLQELQHRVANSLQIIASVLMQGARSVRSGQAKGHLRDAGNRVMSIATMQRQLAASRLGDVVLREYFTDLCSSIGASMISDHDRLSLRVNVDDSVAHADESVSLGLIVTELVINALKHAFPRHRKGTITVDYRADGTAWVLTVSDTGIGMPPDHAAAKPGLGTGIVEALTKQLGASVSRAPANPGAVVSIIHP